MLLRALLGILALGAAHQSTPVSVPISVCDLVAHPDAFDGKRVGVRGELVPDVHGPTLRDPACFDAVVGVISDPGSSAFASILRSRELSWVDVVATMEMSRDAIGEGGGATLTRIESVVPVDRKKTG